MTEFLTATEAAQRLEVKPATLYAHVSRGVLRRDRAADGRGSLFDATPAALAVAPPRGPRSRPGRCPSNGSRSSCP